MLKTKLVFLSDNLLRTLACIWLLIILIVVMGVWRKGLSFDSSIISLLPASQQNPAVQLATDKMAAEFSQRIFLLVSSQDDQLARTAVAEAANRFAQQEGVSELIWRIGSTELGRFDNNYFAYRFSILSSDLRHALLAADYDFVENKALQKVYSPVSIAGGSLIEDPFRLFAELKINQSSALKLKAEDGLLRVSSAEHPTYLLIITLAKSPFEQALQSQVLQVLSDLDNVPGVSIEASGMLLHASAGTVQARSEIQTIGLGSLLSVVVLVLLVFRRWQPLLLMLLPVTVGCVVAASVTMLVFTKVHLITFAFGAGLVGVSVDYALHFICERKSKVPAKTTLIKLLPGLVLGLFSSVLAYAVQTLTPFPGLQQMATFSIAGLIAAWLTVILWLPLLTSDNIRQPAEASKKLSLLRNTFPRLQPKPGIIFMMLVLFVTASLSVFKHEGVDDVRLLQTSPPALLAQEQRVQTILGTASSSQFLLIQAGNIEEALQKEERLQSTLESLINNGYLNGSQGLSDVIPSELRQRENLQLVMDLYTSKLEDYLGRLGLPLALAAKISKEFFELNSPVLSFDEWMLLPGENQWKPLLIQQTREQVTTLIRLQGLSPQGLSRLENFSATDPSITFVDRVADISTVLGKYRTQVSYWLAVAYLVIFLLLTIRYRTQVWCIVLPPFMASVLTMALIIELEGGVNLFHLLALVLVLGIGLDMGIFLTETRGDSYTWLAVTLSSFTSLMAFGLLALSQTPVLHHFGLTVLLGLTLVWLLTLLLRPRFS
ncbi:MMPL family transporter [Aliamphritea ceti]|uniref:MMPL family transporter n=1 Tax=Aliamphritea ceti TaxID=1524258 RepID=UPI0021C39758|nr:MMPL family transporter [Aliamphritea ceti]